ncbi:hypothetical protein SGPA1_40174 [Streptomyces misionensis JCM 4497]
MADRLRPEGADRGRRTAHQRARQEGGGLRPTRAEAAVADGTFPTAGANAGTPAAVEPQR